MMFAIDGAAGIWQRRVECRSPSRLPPLGDDEMIAVRNTPTMSYYGVYRRRVDLERMLAKLSGAEVVLDIDRIICDRCGNGALMVVETLMPEVLCRVCAVRERSDPPPPPAASPPDAPSTACPESP